MSADPYAICRIVDNIVENVILWDPVEAPNFQPGDGFEFRATGGVPVVAGDTFDGVTVVKALVPPEPLEVANRRSIIDKIPAALVANDAFLAIVSPTQTQVLAQTRLLTRQANAAMRLIDNRFDSTEGT
jgi:hypothetical protein